MFTHQPTWDDCQQLLRIVFTTEERERIQLEARKLVPGEDGRPTVNPDLINAAFPLTRPDGDYNAAEGRGRLLIYRQTLMAGLRAAARKPTNLAKVYSVVQGKTESPATFLERLMEAFRQYTPMDPEAPEEILPRYGFPVLIGSDNGPAFVSKVSQGLASVLGADWKLHCAYRPQSSGQVERMNRTLKETLTKLTVETGANWVELLPYALYRVRNSPDKLGLTPYEITFGKPTPIIPNLKSNLIQLDQDNSLLSSLRALQWVHEAVWPKLRELYETGPPPTPHQYRPGDWVLVKRHRQENLEPRWKGPYQIILTTPTAIKK
ncbi:uncharacterized protein LOC125155113 isoform X2 [Prionailurus viverrinus]|uniref:uncharacterized protein LOC125155113 isoform X2 n=1 Tax=Prionailurus viverrinus TaxID=61388 RepID=UPI001FF3033A|nr:uncharacterized protein LOC125155113 isoform X2 [Prionailurus viverrinus]